MSQAWCTADTPVRFFLNVPGLVHCEYTSSVLFKCPRPVHLGYTSWVHLECSRGFPSQSGVSPPGRGETPGTLQMNPTGVPKVDWPGTLEKNQTSVFAVYQPWDIQKEPNRCIHSLPALGHSKRTELVYLQFTSPGTFEKHRTGVFAVYQAWDIQKEPNWCIRSVPGLGHSKRTELVYSQCTRPGKLEKNPGEKPTWRIRLENYECIKGI